MMQNVLASLANPRRHSRESGNLPSLSGEREILAFAGMTWWFSGEGFGP